MQIEGGVLGQLQAAATLTTDKGRGRRAREVVQWRLDYEWAKTRPGEVESGGEKDELRERHWKEEERVGGGREGGGKRTGAGRNGDYML